MYMKLDEETIKDVLKPLGVQVIVIGENEFPTYVDGNNEISSPKFKSYFEQRNVEDLREIKAFLLKQLQDARGDATAIYVREFSILEHFQSGTNLNLIAAFARRQEDLEGVLQFDDLAVSGEHVKFGIALEALKNGYRVRRESWGQDTFIYMVPGSQFVVNRAPLLGIYPEGTEIRYAPHIDMRSGENHCCVWQVSQDAVLAEDWTVCMRGA